MREYEALNWFLFRKPFLNHENYLELIETEESLLECINEPYIKQILLSGSPALYKEIQLKVSEGSLPEELRQSLFNTLTRMTYRSTPFSSFAGVGIGNISPALSKETPDFNICEKENYLRSFEIKDRIRHTNEVVLNPTVSFNHGVAKFITSQEYSGEKIHYKYSFLSFPEELISVVKENPYLLPERLKNHLVKLNLLWPKEKKDHKPIIKSLKSSIEDNDSYSSLTHNIEMFIPSESALSEGIINDVNAAAQVLILLHKPAINKLDKIKQAFISKYESEEVSLLSLIDPDNHIGQLFQKSLEMTHDFEDTKTQQQVLRELIQDKEVKKSGRLILDKHKLEMLSIDKKASPDSFDAVFELLNIPETKTSIYLKHLKGPHAIGHFARYLKLDKKLQKNVKQLAMKEKAMHGEAILAEVIHRSDLLKARDVMPPTEIYEACIPVSCSAENRRSKVIDLSDISVFYDFSYDRFRLRSRSLNREVRPVLTNLYNFEIDSHPIFQFLAYIELQHAFPLISWSWHNLTEQEFLPRVEYKNVILTPSSWLLDSHMIKSIRAKKNNSEDIRNLFSQNNWPLEFELVGKFSRLRFNLHNEFSIQSFRSTIRENETYRMAEVFPVMDLFKKQGTHSHDIIVPFIRTSAYPSIKGHYHLRKKDDVLKEEVLFPPGSEWTYIEIFLPRSHADNFIGQHLKGLAEKTKGTWFFIKYSYPEFHIRLRVKGSEGVAFLKFAKRCFKKGLCAQFTIKTYRREVERYGGIKGCKIFEVLSKQDSLSAIKYSDMAINSQLSRMELWIYAAMISAEAYVDSFGFTPEELSDILSTKKSHPLKTGNAQKFLTSYKNYIFGNVNSIPPEINQLRTVYTERARNQKATLKKLFKLYEEGEIYVSKKSYFLSLIHLSLVRLDLEFDSELEEKILRTVKEIIFLKSQGKCETR